MSYKRTNLERSLAARKHRFAQECANLDPKAEARLAEEGFAEDLKTWPSWQPFALGKTLTDAFIKKARREGRA